METLAPPLELLLQVKKSIEQGLPIKKGIQKYLELSKGSFPADLMRWLSLLQQGQSTESLKNSIPSLHRRILLNVLERGLCGEAIYQHLCQLEVEFLEASTGEIDKYIGRLPFLMLIPMLLIQFPALLFLLFGPLLQNLFHSFARQ